jgi:hypothetical protein
MIREDGAGQEKLKKNLIHAIRREGKRLMQKGSQADNEVIGETTCVGGAAVGGCVGSPV